MIRDVYVDLLFLINFSMDYLCLYVTVKIIHQKIKLSRMLIASALGGAYSVAALFLPFGAPIEFIFDVVICFAICLIAFAQKGRRFSKILLYGFLFVGISMMTGGCMTAIFNLFSKLELPIDLIPADNPSTYIFAILAAAAGLISLMGGRILSRRTSIKLCHLEIKFCNKQFTFTGLCDSGNLVRDPISHKPVIFLDRKKLENEIDLSFLEHYASGRLDPDSPCKNLRLIIVNTAAGTKPLVAAVPQSARIFEDGKRKRAASEHESFTALDVLIAPTDIAANSHQYDAIIPAEIIKNI